MLMCNFVIYVLWLIVEHVFNTCGTLCLMFL